MLIRIVRFARLAPFIPVYLAGFFLSLHYAATLYVNSTFLGEFFSQSAVSILFLLAALFNIAFFLIVPDLLLRLGLRALYLLLIVLTGVSILGLAFSTTEISAAVFFVMHAGTLFIIYYCLDIFLESISSESKTGEIRGLYLTLSSAAIALGPLILTLFVVGDMLVVVYVAAAILLIPAFLLGFLLKYRPWEAISSTRHLHFGTLPFGSWWDADSVRRATLARFVLEVFYTLMMIYTPIYLRLILGFEWAELGIIFTIMLIPFVLLEWPMGEIADRFTGEKEIMSIGFFITGTSLLIMPFLPASFLAWAIILFVSRIGASFIEVSTESHFFKHVDVRDSAFISIFRLARPSGIILGALLGAVSLALFPFAIIFFVVAAVVFFGLKESLYLRDTL